MKMLSLNNNNSAKLTAQISRSSDLAARSISQLSSGNRIARAADDVAGLSISTRLRTQTTALRSSLINTAQASSMLQVADDALRNMDSALQRMMALTTQTASGALLDTERAFLDAEFQNLKQEVDRLLEETRFNGIQLFKTPTLPEPDEPTATEALFVPVNIDNAVLWLDAADTDTITDVGGLATQWRDKSGNGHDMIANAGQEPTTGAATINGLNVISNSNGNRFVSNPFTNFPSTAISLFTTVQTSTNSRSIISYAVPGSNNEFLIFGRSMFINGPSTNVHGNFLDNTTRAIGVTWQSSDGALDTYMEGSSISSTNFQAGNPLNPNGSVSILGEQDNVGGAFSNTQDFVGNMGEIFFYSNVLSDAERDLVDSYQSAKWANALASSGAVAETPGIFSDGYEISRVAESGALVGDLTEVLGNVPFSYQITDGNADGTFSIEASTGEIRVADPERLLNKPQTNLTLTVEADLGGTEPMSIEVNIALSNEGRSNGLNFQIDVSSEDQLTVEIGNIDLDDVFSDVDANIRTKDDAKLAFDVVRDAIDFITDRRAYVGSKQAQADIVTGAIGSKLRNQDAARSVLADTDIAVTSTNFANQTAKNQLAISIAAQANRLHSDVVLSILEDGIAIG